MMHATNGRAKRLAVLLTTALGPVALVSMAPGSLVLLPVPASAQAVNCAGVAGVFSGRLALSAGAMDEDGTFALLRRAAEEDLRACPGLEPQRYYLARMAELGYSGARRAGGPVPGARALAEESLREHPLSVRIATVVARLDGSIKAAQHAVTLDPGYAPARTALAAALAANGDRSAALATLGAGSGQPAAVLIVRARIRLAAGDASGALADAQAAGNAGPKNQPEPTPGRDILRDAEELLGLSSHALGKSPEARRHLERAASLGSTRAREALAEIAPGTQKSR
jgi:tetratricopeptide (TPR) repeat protein